MTRNDTWLAMAQAYIQTTAPKNVGDTVAWLESNGWRLVEARGGPNNAFMLTLESAQLKINVWQDRGPWFLDIKLPGWKHASDLGVVLDATVGRLDHSLGNSRTAEQLPDGVDWIAVLPRALTWLKTTEEAQKIVHSMELRRSRTLFPPTRAKPRTPIARN